MVLDMARPKYKKSTIWRCCKKVDSQGEHFTGIHGRFSEIQFIVNHNSQSDGQNKSAKRWTNLQKKTIHIISLQRNREHTTTVVSHLEQVRQKCAHETSIRFSIKNCPHRESGEKVEEPIYPEQYRRWHPSSRTSWWDKSEWNWK